MKYRSTYSKYNFVYRSNVFSYSNNDYINIKDRKRKVYEKTTKTQITQVNSPKKRTPDLKI